MESSSSEWKTHADLVAGSVQSGHVRDTPCFQISLRTVRTGSIGNH